MSKITLDYIRYIPTLRTKTTNTHHMTFTIFVEQLDHKDVINESLPIDEIKLLVHKWLENHYGHVDVKIDDTDNNHTEFVVSNLKEFKNKFKSYGLKISIEKGFKS